MYDGSEITEAVSVLVHASRSADIAMFCPDTNQMHAVNHTSGEEHAENRNALQEAARIARGAVKPLSELRAADHDALVIPGGFGAAKNLSTWATEGTAATVQTDVERAIREFSQSKKPIGAMCIAPTLLALVLKDAKPKLTVGLSGPSEQWPYGGTIDQLKELGATVEECSIDEICIDSENNLVTAPAYMFEGAPHQIFDNVGQLMEGLLSRA